MLKKGLFACAILLCLFPSWPPPLALALGLAFGIAGANPWRAASSRLSRGLLKWSIVGLGFGMDLHTVIETGRTSYIYTGIGITIAMTGGLLLGRLLRVPFKTAFLIAAGTSICGGSAIAATCTVLDASEEETAVSLTTVFVLNSIALLVFPLVGAAAHLTQPQFGLWAALAIHDTSSVVGAGLRYGPIALLVGTTVKLVRALWIVPLTLFTAAWLRSRAKTAWPWFIGLFLLAAWLHTAYPSIAGASRGIAAAARCGFTLTLFLIGAGLSWQGLQRVGWRALLQGVVLWVVIATTTLLAIRQGLIAL